MPCGDFTCWRKLDQVKGWEDSFTILDGVTFTDLPPGRSRAFYCITEVFSPIADPPDYTLGATVEKQ